MTKLGSSRPAARPGGATTEDARRRRADVIRSAATLFDERGYHSTSVGDIAGAAGMSKATLYHYVGSKGDILAGVHEEVMDRLLSRQEERVDLGLPPEALLLGAMGDVIGLMETHRGHLRTVYEHQRELSTRERATMAAKRERYEDGVVEAIRSGVANGTFREVDPKLAALALFGVCNWAYQWYREDGPRNAAQLAYAFWDLLLNGLADRV